MKDTTFNISLNFIEDSELAQAGIPEEYMVKVFAANSTEAE